MLALTGPNSHLARSGAGKQGRAFGRSEHRGLKVRGLVGTIGPVEIDIAGHRKGRDQHGGPMMSTIQVCLGKRIRRFFRGFLMLVLMMPRMRRLRLGGLVTAILRDRCERDLQWKNAQKKNEKQTLHLASESNIDPAHGQNDPMPTSHVRIPTQPRHQIIAKYATAVATHDTLRLGQNPKPARRSRGNIMKKDGRTSRKTPCERSATR